MAKVITLTTDFGDRDSYVAEMKGVIFGIHPGAVIVDISHAVPPQDIAGAAFVVGAAWRSFPEGTVHVVVVDPGVGGSRRGILVRRPEAIFLAPDNGVLSYVVSAASGPKAGAWPGEARQTELPPGFSAVHLTEPRFWRRPVSSTFHGRDVFAPVAAHLCRGVSWRDFGREIDTIKAFPLPRPATQPGGWRGHVVHIDCFGNIITDFLQEDLEGPDVSVLIAGRSIRGVSRSYEEGGELLALIGSGGRLEIAARNGSAAALLGVRVGDAVDVTAVQRGRA